MSLSVGGSNGTNPYAALQWLLQQGSSASTSNASSPISELLSALGQESAGGSGASGPGTAGGTSSGAPQFDPQTLQTLLAAQDGSQSVTAQPGGDGNPADPGATQQGQGPHGHHHHHGMGAGQQLLDLLDATSAGASTQSATNVDGSTTTTITYADGSSVSYTSAASSGGSSDGSSDGSSNSSSGTALAGAAGVANNNLIEQLIQIQAQLASTTQPQSVVTA